MVAHIVLFEPRADLSTAEQRELLIVLERASREIPTVRRVRIGRRITIGAKYEAVNQETYGFSAVFEFDDVDALTAYLTHPLHAPLGHLFWRSCERTLIIDCSIVDPDDDGLMTQLFRV